MEESKNKYIVLIDRVGNTIERHLSAFGLSTKATRTLVLRGELLEALPEAEQPSDGSRVALVGIERKSLRLECPTVDLNRLSDEEANLLLAMSSLGERYATCIDRKRLDFGRRLSPGNQVSVSLKGITKDLPGVAWYKGELPSCPGTMFGVELIHPGQGTSDGTFRGKRYFTCPPDSGVFVGLDKLTPRKVSDSRSPKRDEIAQANFKSRLTCMDTIVPFVLKGQKERKPPQELINQPLEIYQRVVTFIEDYPVRGTVRYIGQEEDASGNMRTIVGLELDEQYGNGTGRRNGRVLFVSKKDFACFVDIGNVIREEDFDENPKETKGGKSAGKTRTTNSFNSADGIKDVVESSPIDATTFIEQQRQTWLLYSRKDQQEENLQTQLSEMEQRVKRMQEQLREKDYELEISERLREQLTNLHEQQRHLHGQLREKDEHKENLQRQSREIQEQLREKNQQEENLERQLREIQEQLREKNQQEENLQRQLREIQEQLREKDQQEKSAQRQVTALERQLRIKDQQVNELQITLSTAQQALSEHQRRQVTPDWVISRDQIQLTDKLLGRGGWGSVVEGKYCGCSVAVKQIHELILSPHNRTLFEREMDVASRCRHPCLLQFVGATNEEGSPLFVTELMESSLRALLEQRPLAGTEVSTISLDVARALNYLHQKKPSPIIHRDISSANVLLWRQGDQWRGKVSDYGTANFMQHTMTVGPGATIYIAPEALTSNQTVKVDVYSFGILLCEMCIRELPDPERRDQQIAMVKDHLLRALIRGCLQSDPEARPNMEEIIEELEEPV